MTPLAGGLLGLVQTSLLPGVLLLLWRRRTCSFPAISLTSSILLVFCFSGVASFLLVLFLQATGSNTRMAWLVIGFAELLAWFYLAWNGSSAETSRNVLEKPSIVTWLGLIVFAGFTAQLVMAIVGHWPGVFAEWDTVINWNRWARDWADGQWPYLAWGYSQLIPAMWSITYLLQGSTEIEFFVRGWMGLFPLAFMLLLLDMALQWRRIAPLLAAAAVVPLLLGPYAPILDSGYVDVPLTFFTLLTAHCILLAKQHAGTRQTWLLFAATAAAAALLTKQGGLIAVALMLWGFWTCRTSPVAVRYALIIFLAFIVPWYVMDWFKGSEESVVAYVTDAIYGEETLPQRMVRALTETLPAILLPQSGAYLRVAAVLAAFTGILLSCKNTRGRFCSIAGAVYLLLWAGFFSYDGRNLVPALPLLILGVLIGYEESIRAFFKSTAPTSNASSARPAMVNSRISSIPGAVTALVLLVAAALPQEPQGWEKVNNRLRRQTGDAEFNQQLIDFVSRPDFSGSIYTTYPQVASIDELRPHLFADFGTSRRQPPTVAALQSGQPLCAILATFSHHEEISYMLLHRSVYPGIIDAALADGSLQLQLNTPLMRLMRVNCSTPPEA